MDRHELNKMFDGLTPAVGREKELLDQLLQENVRRKKPMKNWKRVVVAAVAAVLLVTAATAAVPGLNQRLLDYLGVAPEDTQTAGLLVPGATAVDVTKESNGATLHVTQVLRDRYTIMLIADFTAPEGNRLYIGEPDTPTSHTYKGFNYLGRSSFELLDETGESMKKSIGGGDGGWDVLEDDDPSDNRVSLVYTVHTSTEENTIWDVASLWVPAVDLSYYDPKSNEVITVYSGDWSFEVPLPQKDIGWTMVTGQVSGELMPKKDAVATGRATGELSKVTKATMQGELYLSPVTLRFGYRWVGDGALHNLPDVVTLTTADGETVGMDFEIGTEGIPKDSDFWQVYYYCPTQVIDPAKFQGGTMTLSWDWTWESGSFTIPLDDLQPVKP